MHLISLRLRRAAVVRGAGQPQGRLCVRRAPVPAVVLRGPRTRQRGAPPLLRRGPLGRAEPGGVRGGLGDGRATPLRWGDGRRADGGRQGRLGDTREVHGGARDGAVDPRRGTDAEEGLLLRRGAGGGVGEAIAALTCGRRRRADRRGGTKNIRSARLGDTKVSQRIIVDYHPRYWLKPPPASPREAREQRWLVSRTIASAWPTPLPGWRASSWACRRQSLVRTELDYSWHLSGVLPLLLLTNFVL